MRAGKIILIVTMVIGFVTPALAQNLTIGPKGNLMTGMKLEEAFKKLGYPDALVVKRGASSSYDHVEISYPALGVVIRTMSGGKTVEAIEIQPGFKGKFDTGLTLGSAFSSIVGKYGPPVTLSSQMASYPEKGYYFLFSDDKLLSAKMFSKSTKLLELQLVKP